MLSTFDFRYDTRDAAARAKARIKFLKTALDTLRRLQTFIADQGADDLFVDLAILKRVIPERFSRTDRGYPLPDPDMQEAIIGPVGRCLYMFDGIVKDSVVQDFDKALKECEAKIEAQLKKERAAANVERRSHGATA